MDPDDRPCSVDGCSDTKIKAKGLCRPHYSQLRKYGTVDAEEIARIKARPRPNANLRKGVAPCPVDGCPKKVYRGEYCYAHYMKWYRYGTPTPVHAPTYVDLVGQRFGLLVVAERVSGGGWLCQCDCGARTHATSYSLTHGQKKSCGSKMHVRKSSVSYSAPHARCFWRWGSAKQHACVTCGKRAIHWAYDHTDPEEAMAAMGPGQRKMPISLWEEFYMPMCAGCHKRLDNAHSRTKEG